MTIIVEHQPANADLITSVTGSASRVVANLEELKNALADQPSEFAIVLGANVDLGAAAALADALRVTRPATSVILIRRRLDTSVLAEALRSGMREVVEERDLTGLGQAVRRAQEVWEAVHGPSLTAANSTGKVITIFSPKGGVGKTTLAVNLALAISEKGRRKVCLVDLDLGFGDVAITLQLFPARTIADTVHLQAELDYPVLETLLTPHRDGLMALVAPVQPDARDAISPSLVARILKLLKENFDYVVIDTAPSFDEHVLQALDETDELLLVTTLDVPTLKNVKIAVETLDLLNFPAQKRRLILNRADDKVGLSGDKVSSTLNMTIDRRIPTSAQVASATNAGEPIVGTLPRHAVSQAITDLAGALTASPSDNSARRSSAESRDSSPPKRGLLRRSR